MVAPDCPGSQHDWLNLSSDRIPFCHGKPAGPSFLLAVANELLSPLKLLKLALAGCSIGGS